MESPTTCRVSLLEGHANALALNKDGNQIAIAGRNLLKVYSVADDAFNEMLNMRGGKNQNLSYSSNDVAWCPLDSNILATASTNGVVGIWDLSRFGRQKQLIVYNEHERTAHTVTFSNNDQYILISGSQDGTIKCFDMRCEKSINTFCSNSESVRDLKFSPHSSFYFSAVSENGTVQLWDLRKNDKCVFQYTAHSNPIYTSDWHPKNNWLATGSRDRQIKIWNMDGRARLEYTIHTIAVVGRVKWRPQHEKHIASSALVFDYSVHVWDIDRPYIPYASFNEHTNITTDIEWKSNDPNCLFSTSKDSTIYKHAFKDATRPAEKANTQGACSGRCGNISFAKKAKSSQAAKADSKNSDSPKFVVSNLMELHIEVTRTEDESFCGYAEEILLKSRNFSKLCEINIAVSKKYNKHNATTLWNFLKLLYGSNDFVLLKETRHSFSKQKNSFRRPIQAANEWMQQSIEQNADGISTNQGSDSASNSPDDDIDEQANLPTSAVILSETQIINKITFDNFELLKRGFIYVGTSEDTKSKLSLPDTALHHDVQAARPPLETKSSDREKSPATIAEPPSILKITNLMRVAPWEPHKFIADSLLLLADVGDIQVPVSILIALGETRKLLPLDDLHIEYWLHTYVDQLQSFELWNKSCEICNLAWFRSVRARNQPSTSVHINCGTCGRSIGAGLGGYCKTCKSMHSAKCSVCDLIVRGIYAWCQGCSHGGHIHHLQKYFATNSKCPKCGHLCTYG